MRIIMRMIAAGLMSAASIGAASAEIKIGVAGPMSCPNAAYACTSPARSWMRDAGRPRRTMM
jgi:hypothetical protein